MKPGRIFWGVLFLSFGILLMLERFSSTPIHYVISWKLWPLLLVMWGISLIATSKALRYGITSFAAIFLAVLVMSVVAWDWDWERDSDRVSGADQVFQESFSDSIHRASFILESGAGTFTLEDTTGDLMAAKTTTSMGTYRLERDRSGDWETLNLMYGGRKVGWRGGRVRNTAQVRLHPAPVWDLRFEVGASRLNVDATPFNVEAVRIDAGAADVSLKLGDRAENTTVSINTGASSVKVLVPSSSGCEVNVTAPLSSKKFSGFQKIEKGLYRTENYSTTSKRISIEIDAGVSSIRVIRY